MKTLVVGCDASGKSTFLDIVHTNYGDAVGESSRSDEAQTFKRANLSRRVDHEFVNQREALYLGLSHKSLLAMNDRQDSNIVTTDSGLVTRLSHNVMRQIICAPSLSNDQIIERWLGDEADADVQPPDILVLTHTEFPVIRQRIVNRQNAGDKNEKFWGFNSPFFLEAYQQRWRSMVESLGHAAFSCLSLDTGKVSPTESIKRYDEIRNNLAKK